MAIVGLNIGGTFTLEVGLTGRTPTNTLTLPVTPSQSVSLMFRTGVTVTQSGFWVDRFGLGPKGIIIQGDSAWDSPDGNFNGQHVDGNTAVRHLAVNILEYYANEQQKSPNSQTLIGINGATGETWELEPVGQPQFYRTPASPMTIAYSLQFVVLKDLGRGPIAKAADEVAPTFSSSSSIATWSKSSVSSAQQRSLAKKQTPYLIRQVQSGDTLYSIAQSYLPKQANASQVDSFVRQIVELNNLSNESNIAVGLWLKIP